MKPFSILLGVALVGAASLVAVHSDILLSDTFSDGERITQNLPDSARWGYGRATADNYVSGDGTLIGTNNSAGTGFFAYFANTPLALQVGETMEFSFDYKYGTTNAGDNTLRANLFNTGGSRTTNDNTGMNNAIFNGWAGYGLSGQFASGALRYRVNERAAGANNLGVGYTAPNSAVQTNGGVVDTWYTARLTLDYINLTTMRITSQLGGQTLIATDTVGLVTSFDAVVILASPNGWMAIDNLQVSVVPEPSVALLLGAGLLAVGLTRRQLR